MESTSVILILFILLLIVSVAYTQWRLWQLTNKYGEFLKDSDGNTIQKMVNSYQKDVKDALIQLDQIAEFVAKMHTNAKYSISKQALIRFNPFGDTGGDQSFVFAMLDSHNNGVVLSSVHARTGTRVYAKAIEDGLSRYNLSDEETMALQKALNHKKKQGGDQ